MPNLLDHGQDSSLCLWGIFQSSRVYMVSLYHNSPLFVAYCVYSLLFCYFTQFSPKVSLILYLMMFLFLPLLMAAPGTSFCGTDGGGQPAAGPCWLLCATLHSHPLHCAPTQAGSPCSHWSPGLQVLSRGRVQCGHVLCLEEGLTLNICTIHMLW